MFNRKCPLLHHYSILWGQYKFVVSECLAAFGARIFVEILLKKWIKLLQNSCVELNTTRLKLILSVTSLYTYVRYSYKTGPICVAS
jgi:hypothetical protein